MSWDSGGGGHTCCGNPEQGELYWNGNMIWSQDFAQGEYTVEYDDWEGGEVTLRFSSNINQGSHDEAWGINDVWIRNINDS
jgi:hypothetical protein